MKKRQLILGFILSGIFIYLIVWEPQLGKLASGQMSFSEALFDKSRIDFSLLLYHIQHASLGWLAIAFIITPIHTYVRSHRWILLLKPIKKISMLDSFSLQTIGYFASGVLPLRAGELVRGLLLSQKYNLSKSTCFTNIIVERMLDIISLLAMFGLVGLIFKSDKVAILQQGTIILSLMSLFGLIVILYLAFTNKPMHRTKGVVRRVLPEKLSNRVVRSINNIVDGIRMLRKVDQYFVVTWETIFLWVLYVAQEFCVIIAFDFHKEYALIAAAPVTAALVVLVINAIALSIPSAPGSVGAFHLASIFSLGLFGVEREPALGFALVLHTMVMGSYILGGFGFMWHEGLKLATIRKLSEQKEIPTD